ncbi:MAG: phage tail sheath subtilisin-like domain-containing protein [Calothrix sp. MO_167.B42]|nr:phage tail sheath subtilisin-like domain-containing protein [Calothrix sp. MO_167.B42]
MPITPTYPGVYIEEIPSGVRTIIGVATSITAFIGRALRGPVNDPITINNYGDYERIFGGLWVESSMSYAVRDFYLNGGSQAIIVRLVAPDAEPATITMSLPLVATNVGSWGNNLSVEVDYDTKDPDNDTLFNLTISEDGGITEKFINVSTDPNNPRYVPRVLQKSSTLVRVDKDDDEDWIVPDTRPPAGKTSATDGSGTDGDPLTITELSGSQSDKTGLYALEKVDLFNLLCIPPHVLDGDIELELITAAATYCEERRAMFLIDPPSDWRNKKAAKDGIAEGVGTTSKNAAIFFPRLKQANLLRDNQIETFAPCGAVAGIFARTDAQRGVWKAPAGLEATLNGVPALSVSLTDAENGELNPLGINCLRSFPGVGRVVWGSRTLQGADRLASEWKYIPVRRLTLFLEESLYRGTQWVVFEPNDEPLWAQIRLNIGAFMNNLFRQGAFQGKSPREAYFVKCDKETTTQNDIDRGIVNIIVGFAPLKPAEFVIIKFQQIAGNIAT